MAGVAANQALAMEVVSRALSSGTRTFCVCPGGRNAPLVQALEPLRDGGVEVLDFFDERGAAFFALGRALRDDRPAAVVTTSGTAAGELLPAMIEAYYSSARLLAITADRPRAYRGTGAPQSIEQPSLFGTYARQAVDIDRAGEAWHLDPCCWPVHLNVSFDEPLLGGWQHDVAADLDGGDALEGGDAAPGERLLTLRVQDPDPRLAAAAARIRRPLVILGALHSVADRDDAAVFCERLGAPAIAEAGSRLRRRLSGRLLRGGEASVFRALDRQDFDGVVRIGDVPSFRFWRDLERHTDLPVISVSRRPWSGLTHGTHHDVPADARLPLAGLGIRADFPPEVLAALNEEDDRLARAREQFLRRFPLSEPALVRQLSCSIPEGSFVYVGNSLPIREWNEFAALDRRDFEHGESRGANGIDGQLSTFLGGCRPDRENWAVVGDLTALYDLPALWALPLVRANLRIVVMNNHGGRIFRRMFENPRFQNVHAIGFDLWARMFDAAYSTDPSLLPEAGPVVLELRPDLDQTDSFWEAMRLAGAR